MPAVIAGSGFILRLHAATAAAPAAAATATAAGEVAHLVQNGCSIGDAGLGKGAASQGEGVQAARG